MPIEGWVQLMGVDLANPLPVQLRDKDGKPVNLLGGLTQAMSGGPSRKTDTRVGLNIPVHDYIALTYTGDNLTGVVYKTGGSGGDTEATLTLAYTGG